MMLFLGLVIPTKSLGQVVNGNLDSIAKNKNRSVQRGVFKFFPNFYPVNTDPGITWKSNMTDKERILFEANPEVRISIYNNMLSGITDLKSYTKAFYLHFKPVFRMYQESSYPVKTGSTPILFGTQHLFKIPRSHTSSGLRQRDFSRTDFFSISFETGHYSNGQKMGAFTENYEDGSVESEAAYDAITPETNLSEILNRKSGNFSTNLTELKLNYRFNKLDDQDFPYRTWSLTLGSTIYHNNLLYVADIGGYSANDIKIYGRWRHMAGVEYIKIPLNSSGWRYALSASTEYISGAHPSVEPWRLDLGLKVYPFPKITDLGFTVGYTAGHDNYNYRFVDSGQQISLGLTFSVFPPFEIPEKIGANK